jgi:hypothetical protein
MASFLSFLRNVKKRRKAKQDPSGLSFQPASSSESHTLAPTSNLIPSAADSASNVDLTVTTPEEALNQQGSASSHHSAAKATVLNVFKFTLAALSAASDHVPVPGLKLAMEGLLSVIERVQVCYEYLISVCFEQAKLLYRRPQIAPKVFAN